MSQRKRKPLFHLASLVCIVAIAPVSIFPARSLAQTPPPQILPIDTMRPQLQTRIHCQTGVVTLRTVMQSLSEQTHIKIEAADFLVDRRLNVSITDMSAQEALDTLAELYDWRWFAPQPGRILLTRKRPVIPEKVADVPAAMQAALPMDFRVYTGIGVPLDKLPAYADPQKQALVQRLRLLDATHTRERKERVTGRLNSLVQHYIRTLFADMKPELEAGKTIRYDRLSDEQKTAFKAALLLGSYQTIEAKMLTFFHKDLQPYQIDPMQAEITLEHGSALMIGSKTGNVSTGEGAAIEGLKPKSATLPALKLPPPVPEP